MRIAALQMNSGTQPGPNLDQLEALAADAAGQGATYLLSPEVSVVFAENREGLRAVAGPWDGNPAIERAAQIARKLGVTLHLGSLAVALPDGRFANRSVLFRPDGRIAATYDKIHLFDATLPGLKNYRESETYAGGDAAVVTDAPGFSLGMTICYDVRFPALHRALAQALAQVIAVPAAFTVPTGMAHWHLLLRARAVEAGLFVVGAAQGGLHEDGRATYGHSLAVGPWGEVLLDMAARHGEVGFADVDLTRIDDVRARVPALSHRRTIDPPN